MREIIFRGKYEGKWVYGSLHIVKPTEGILEPLHYYICPLEVSDVYRVDPDTVGQYIGLKDKNGVEIYEGDIMKKGDFLYLVEWRNITIWLKPLDKWSIEHEARPTAMNMGSGIMRKVIGNKWDNPEQLKGA